MPSRNIGSLGLLYDIFKTLPTKYRLLLLAALLCTVVSGLAELLSLGATIPFLTAISSPTLLQENTLFLRAANFLHLSSNHNLIAIATLLLISSSIAASLVRIFNTWANGQIAAHIGFKLSFQLYTNILSQSYLYHVENHTSKILRLLSIEANNTVTAITYSFQALTGIVVSLFVLAGLLFLNPQVALIALTSIGISYFLLALYSRRLLYSNSTKIASFNASKLKLIQESMDVIRDIILDASKPHYVDQYALIDLSQRKSQANNLFLTNYPRYLMESIGIAVIALLALYLEGTSSPATAALPLLGTIALGAQRLLPLFQLTYSSWAIVNGFKADIVSVLGSLRLESPVQKASTIPPSVHKFNSLELKDVSFKYPTSTANIINNVSFKLKAGERIGIVGKTGSGKSTLVDIMLGLLTPSSGFLVLNNHPTDLKSSSSLRLWHSMLAHVPQNISLIDASIAQNIALGTKSGEIDLNLVIDCARRAQISEFISSLPDAYNTNVGERGVKLSGGQIQRIGIARALYKKPQVLFFDEGTSALDSEVEEELIDAINNLEGNITIMMIAHRTSTLRDCDKIITVTPDGVKTISKPIS